MKLTKNLLSLLCVLLFSVAAGAQSASVGVFQSYKGLGFTLQTPCEDHSGFNNYFLFADMASVFSGISTSPGVKFDYSHNYRLHTFTSARGEDLCIFAGSGVSAGWVQDDMRPSFGFEAALTGSFGARVAFERGVVLTLGVSLDTGAFIFRDNGNIKFSVYRNGLYHSFYPYLCISYLLK